MQTKKDRIPTGFLSFFPFVTSLKEISIIIAVWLSRAAAVSHIWVFLHYASANLRPSSRMTSSFSYSLWKSSRSLPKYRRHSHLHMGKSCRR